MQATIESTDKVVELVVDGATVPARVWEGVTASGVPFHAFITRVAVKEDEDTAEFERDLYEQKPASPEVQSIPLRLDAIGGLSSWSPDDVLSVPGLLPGPFRSVETLLVSVANRTELLLIGAHVGMTANFIEVRERSDGCLTALATVIGSDLQTVFDFLRGCKTTVQRRVRCDPEEWQTLCEGSVPAWRADLKHT